MHSDGHGLYLRVREGSGASWTLRYKRHGKDRWMDVGNPLDTSLAEARKAARAERVKLDGGAGATRLRNDAQRTQKRAGKVLSLN